MSSLTQMWMAEIFNFKKEVTCAVFVIEFLLYLILECVFVFGCSCVYLHSLTKAWMAGGVHYKRKVVCSQTGDVRQTIFPTDGASRPLFQSFLFPLF